MRTKKRSETLWIIGVLTGVCFGTVSAQKTVPLQRTVLYETVWLDTVGGPVCTLDIDMAFFAEEAGERYRADVLQLKKDVRLGFGQNKESEISQVEHIDKNALKPVRKTMCFSTVNRAVAQEAFGREPDKTSFATTVALYRDATVEAYRKEAGKVAKTYPDAVSLNYAYMIKGTVVDTGSMYLTYRLEKSVFTGGAHPMTTVNYLNFSADGKVGLTEAFGADYAKKLEKLLLDRLMVQESVKKKEQLTEKDYLLDDFFISENFYYRDGRFVFVYNPYEIAPYSKGIVEIAVPLSVLRRNITNL